MVHQLVKERITEIMCAWINFFTSSTKVQELSPTDPVIKRWYLLSFPHWRWFVPLLWQKWHKMDISSTLRVEDKGTRVQLAMVISLSRSNMSFTGHKWCVHQSITDMSYAMPTADLTIPACFWNCHGGLLYNPTQEKQLHDNRLPRCKEMWELQTWAPQPRPQEAIADGADHVPSLLRATTRPVPIL
jgi:hypothetical protein